jgi:hypothetical protein
VGWGTGAAGGESGRTIAVAVVIIADVDAISIVVDCCSWRKVVRLVRYASGDGDCQYRGPRFGSLFGGVGGLLIFS